MAICNSVTRFAIGDGYRRKDEQRTIWHVIARVLVVAVTTFVSGALVGLWFARRNDVPDVPIIGTQNGHSISIGSSATMRALQRMIRLFPERDIAVIDRAGFVVGFVRVASIHDLLPELLDVAVVIVADVMVPVRS